MRLLRKRLQRVVAPAEPHLDLLCPAPRASSGNLPLALVAQPQASPTGEARPVKLCNAPATNLTVDIGQAFEPRPAAAEVAFCPYNRDLQLDNARASILGARGATRTRSGRAGSSVRSMSARNASARMRRCGARNAPDWTVVVSEQRTSPPFQICLPLMKGFGGL
jgi:hypothetical protein